MTTQALERLGRLEQWFRDYATSFATRLYASDFRERAEELASIRQSLGGGEAYAYMMPPDKVILAAHWTGTLPPFGWMPLYTHPKPAQVDEAKSVSINFNGSQDDAERVLELLVTGGYLNPHKLYQAWRIVSGLSHHANSGTPVDAEGNIVIAALQPEPRGTAQGGEG